MRAARRGVAGPPMSAKTARALCMARPRKDLRNVLELHHWKAMRHSPWRRPSTASIPALVQPLLEGLHRVFEILDAELQPVHCPVDLADRARLLVGCHVVPALVIAHLISSLRFSVSRVVRRRAGLMDQCRAEGLPPPGQVRRVPAGTSGAQGQAGAPRAGDVRAKANCAPLRRLFLCSIRRATQRNFPV
jgi:AcrR family transcriptional regulator